MRIFKILVTAIHLLSSYYFEAVEAMEAVEAIEAIEAMKTFEPLSF